MSPSNKDRFTSSFAIWRTFISFPCLTAQAKTSNTMLNKSGESGQPCLVPNFGEKAFSCEYDVSCGLVTYGLYYVEVHSTNNIYWQGCGEKGTLVHYCANVNW